MRKPTEASERTEATERTEAREPTKPTSPVEHLHSNSASPRQSPDDSPLAVQIRAAADLLERISEDRTVLAEAATIDQRRLIHAAGMVWDPDTTQRRRMRKACAKKRKKEVAQRGERVLDKTGIRTLRRRPTFTTPNIYPPDLVEVPDGEAGFDGASVSRQHCYGCKSEFFELHHFYDQMCPTCAELNYRKRDELADLTGRVALLTGGRVKIGFQAGLKLLRCGADLIVTTRFPRDAAARYAEEPGFSDWSDRLQIYGLDLRHTPSVEAFCTELLQSRDRLDIIINNACQTVRRPPEFYAHMMAKEIDALGSLPEHVRQLLGAYEGLRGPELLPDGPVTETGLAALRTGTRTDGDVPGLTHSAQLSQLPLLADERRSSSELVQEALFPVGRLDKDSQQVDLRETNSWRMLMADVPTVELLEVHLVNAVAPFVLNARLKPLMMRTENQDKHIVNVSAVEGQFYRNAKTTRHPHTNMAKAAMNMMTRTAATDYHNDGIHMNAVDTGWITDEDPEALALRKTEMHRFHPPLDIVDGAARIVDPVISGINSGTHVWGQFLKDYVPTDW